MQKFYKKPIVIEAIQFTEENKDRVRNWITCTADPSFNEQGKPIMIIGTLEGDMVANLGDWIIRGIQGEYYPCKPDIFEATYEPVDWIMPT